MAGSITRTYTFTDGTTAFGSQVESEVQNIVTTINNLDSATLSWSNVKSALGNFTGNISMNSNKITGLAAGAAAGESVRFEQLIAIQSVHTASTTATSTTSASFTDVTNMTVTITPTSASNKILVQVYGAFEFGSSASGQNASITILRGSTNLGDASTGVFTTTSQSASILSYPFSWTYLDSPASTSALVYKIQIKSDGTRTTYWNRLATTGTGMIRVTEVIA